MDQAKNLRDMITKKMLTYKKEKDAATSTRIITVTSGKGGVGKSNISLNLSMALKKFYKNVIVFDADLGLANIDVLLGITPKATLVDVIDGYKKMQEVITDGPNGINIIPGGSAMEDVANLKKEDKERLMLELLNLSFADIILIDTGAGISENVTNFVYASSEVIVVTTGEPTAFTDAYAMVKAVYNHNPDAKIYLVVNMINSEAEAKEVFNGLNSVTKRFLNREIDYLGFVVRDVNLEYSVLKQKPVLLAYPGSMVASCIRNLASELYVRGKNLKHNMKKFTEKFFKA